MYIILNVEFEPLNMFDAFLRKSQIFQSYLTEFPLKFNHYFCNGC